jgi:hypothetical protein
VLFRSPIVVGIAQGTTSFADFGTRLLESAKGNLVEGAFDRLLGAQGLFGLGTGSGGGAGFLASLGLAGIGGNAPRAGFTGPPVNGLGATTTGFAGLLQSAGGAISGFGAEGLFGASLALGGFAGSLAGNGAFGKRAQNNSGAFGASVAASLALAPATLGLGPLLIALFGTRGPSATERRRMSQGDMFREAGIFPTLAFAKNRPEEFRGDVAGFTGSMTPEMQALALGLGFEGTEALENFPRTLGRRASGLGLTEDQVRAENRRLAAASGVSLDDAAGGLTNQFLRFQQEGKGREITQAAYNDLKAAGEEIPGLKDYTRIKLSLRKS